MSTRVGVAVMAALLALYIVLVGWRAVVLISTGDPVGVTMGISLLVLPLIAMWALAREIMFGASAAKLGARLDAEGALPDDEVAVRTSGRVVRDDADAVFPRYRTAVEQNPEDWQAWYRLGLAYDASGDRRRARAAIRNAIRFERESRRTKA